MKETLFSPIRSEQFQFELNFKWKKKKKQKKRRNFIHFLADQLYAFNMQINYNTVYIPCERIRFVCATVLTRGPDQNRKDLYRIEMNDVVRGNAMHKQPKKRATKEEEKKKTTKWKEEKQTNRTQPAMYSKLEWPNFSI